MSTDRIFLLCAAVTVLVLFHVLIVITSQDPVLNLFRYVSRATPSRRVRADMPILSSGSSYTLVVSTFDESMSNKNDVLRLLPDDMVLQAEPIRTCSAGSFVTECIRITPCEIEGRD